MAKKIFFTILMFSQAVLAGCVQGPYNGPMSGWGHMMGYGYSWLYGGFMWLIILVIVGVAVYFLLKSPRFKGFDHSAAETPLDILKKRYAKGEINKEEFEQKKKDLE